MFQISKKILLGMLSVSAALLISCGQSDADAQTEDISSQIFTMGTVFTVRAIADQGAQEAVSAAEERLYDADRVLSWRNEGSVPALFNQNHAADAAAIRDLIGQSLQVSRDSGGAFDMTILPLTRLWQFDRLADADFDPAEMTVPDAAAVEKARSHVDYTRLHYDPETAALSAEDPDLMVELGAVGKGYAIDQALAAMEEKGVTGAMISAGSSIGLLGSKEGGEPFKVALRDPRGELSDYIALISTTDCSISTSGDYEQFFEQDGVRYHHILDPGTGYPADSGLMQVTIIGENGALGDALSTACFVLGLDEGMKLANQYDVFAIFVDNDKNIWYNNADVLDILEIVSDVYTLCN